MNDDRLIRKIGRILEESEPTTHNSNGDDRSSLYIRGGDGSLNIAGNLTVDHGTVVLNAARRPGERIDDDQLQELRDRVESLAKVDCLIGAARNPKDTRSIKKRHDSARRKRWHAFRDAFHLKSYTHLTVGQYDDALAWLDAQKHAALDLLGPPAKGRFKRKPSLKRPVRLATMLLVVLAVPLIFSVSRTQPPIYGVSGPISAITVDQAPIIQPADVFTHTGPLTVVPLQPGFHCHAGCSFFKPAGPIKQPVDNATPTLI